MPRKSKTKKRRSTAYHPSVLVLDLDNTLIHALEQYKFGRKASGEDDKVNEQKAIEKLAEKGIKADFEIASGGDAFSVYKRPYVDSFLRYSFANFDYVIIWSAGTKVYVHRIVEKLFEKFKTKPDMVLTREDCEKHIDVDGSSTCKKNMCKIRRRLAKLGEQYDHNRVLFIDDLPYKIKSLPRDRIYEIKSFDVDIKHDDKEFLPFKNKKCKGGNKTKNAETKESGQLDIKCLSKRRYGKKRKNSKRDSSKCS